MTNATWGEQLPRVAPVRIQADHDRMTVDDLATTGVNQVVGTSTAVSLLTMLSETHGGLLIHQAGGICAGSDPMCHPVGDYRVGLRDVLLGDIALPDPLPAVQIWVAADRIEHWRRSGMTVDAVAGRGSGFSLEAPEGVRFVASAG